MCGICGIAPADPSTFIDQQLLHKMNQSISHRGPDGFGEVIEHGVGLAMRRLSIIDVDGSQQPITNETESIKLVFNGEIYNYKELRERLLALGHRFNTKGDGETIVHGYEEWGFNGFTRLNGMFACAIWDKRHRRLILARDRMGIKPLYYTVVNNTLYFGSELKTLLQHPEVRSFAEMDPVSLRQYLAFEYIPTPRSIFKGIYKLPPGHYLVWENGNLHLESYWDISLSPSEAHFKKGPNELNDYKEKLIETLKASVKLELVSDVPLGIFLSGGVDSSAVAAMMSLLNPGKVNSFSIGFQDSSFDESYYANLVAKHLGTNHHIMTLEPHMLWELVPDMASLLDEPMADSSIIPTFLLSKFARTHVKVALGGDGGDELFAGYPTLQAHALANYYGRLPKFLGKGLIPSMVNYLPVSTNNISLDFKAKRFVSGMQLPPELRHHLWLGSIAPSKIDSLLSSNILDQVAHQDIWEPVRNHAAKTDSSLIYNRIMYLDMKMYLENDILTKVDRASMAASLEVRVPLLNRLFLDFVLGLPFELKLKPNYSGINFGINATSKYLFKRALADYLPDEILRRKKKGFNMPVAKWLKSELRPLVLDTFSEARMKKAGIFNYPEIKSLVDDHFNNRRDNRKPLWTLLVFELWREHWNTTKGAM